MKNHIMVGMTHLPDMIEDYLAKSGMTATAFGKEVMNNPNFVFDLRKGAGWNSRTPAKIQAFIAKHPPKDDAA